MVLEVKLQEAVELEPEAHTTSVSAYVELPIAEVFARFSDPGIDGLLASTMRRTLSELGRGELLSIHAWPTIWVASGTVRVPVSWRVRSADGGVHEGSATISMLVVQSGAEAITELLVTQLLDVDDGIATAETTRRILDELTLRLEGKVLP